MRFLSSIVLATFSLPCLVSAAFGYTDDGSNYVIGKPLSALRGSELLIVLDTGASLVFKVSKTNGDITSMVYNGVVSNIMHIDLESAAP
jgi:rhamnogalacturonan endolyase